MNMRILLTHLFILSLVFAGLAVGAQVYAQDYVPLTKGGIPLMTGDTLDMQNLLNALLGLTVGIAALLAVIMLVIGGFEYMTTDSAFKMGNAKDRITNAIIGLLIVLAAVLILQTINPDIVSLNIFGNVPGA